ncbi:MAG TPA: sigma 54-interacting transcriptional regulator [Longimicrobium sp.]|nr:sigma 54-interacting transcriptional regulator [Longimicrobium sp.]
MSERDDTFKLQPSEEEGSGLAMLVLTGESVATFPLPRSGQVVIGRSREADIYVDDASLSRLHASLELEPELRIRDLGSVNGTRVRQELLPPFTPTPLSPGTVVELGAVTLFVQRERKVRRPRRIWTHAYLEGRLEDECARNPEVGFAVVRVHVEGVARHGEAQEALSRVLRPQDCMAAYAPGEYEVLFTDVPPTRAQERARQILAELAKVGLVGRFGVACFPRDGRDPDTLMAEAGEGLRPRHTESGTFPRVVRDPAMVQLYQFVPRVAQSEINVLILGETGVGKEVLAEELHRRSRRAKKPFVRINCAALSDALFESELFGHERGAFTGAMEAKIGLLESAQEGTVMLDEVGELPLTTQAKLLRVLEERAVRRVGGLGVRPLDVRILAATNRELEVDIAQGRFRRDLFFRLNGISLTLPPLRERTSEIESLAKAFITQACRMERRPELALSAEALGCLHRYNWPGNIRELRNVIERAVLLCTGHTIGLEHLPLEKMTTTWMMSAQASRQAAPAAEAEPVSERQRILDALERCAGNQTRCAQLLGISRRTLVSKLDAYGIARPRKKV